MEPTLVETSIAFLKCVRGQGSRCEDELAVLKTKTTADLARGLSTDTHRKAFWLNLYNGLVQLRLAGDKTLFEDRERFYDSEILQLKDRPLSLNQIEHGVLRRSRSLYTLGYFQRWFVADWERQLHVERLDARIHFALNCGAESCPAVYYYSPERLEAQLDRATQNFLQQDVSYDRASDTLSLSRLFFWFNGDFGGAQGIKKLVESHTPHRPGKRTALSYKDYDWNLRLAKYAD